MDEFTLIHVAYVAGTVGAPLPGDLYQKAVLHHAGWGCRRHR